MIGEQDRLLLAFLGLLDYPLQNRFMSQMNTIKGSQGHHRTVMLGELNFSQIVADVHGLID